MSIDVFKIIEILNNKKYFITLITLIGTTLAFVLSINSANIYTSKAIVVASSQSKTSNTKSQLSGFASLAGVSLASDEINKTDNAIEIMKSLKFFENYVHKNSFFYPLMAAEGWDKKTDTLIIDDKVFDQNKNKWVSKSANNIDGRPSIQEAHQTFLNNLTISKRKGTGIIEISIKHFSPNTAKNFLDQLINDINEIIRESDIQDSRRQLKFLEEEIAKTQLSEIKYQLSSLVQSQVQTIMLANKNPEYVFKVLSGPIAPEIKSGPQRGMIIVLSFLLSIILSMIMVVAQFIIKNATNRQY